MKIPKLFSTADKGKAPSVNGPAVQAISVNLLPSDILLRRSQYFKLSMINKISVGVLVVLIFFTSAAIAMTISQKAELKSSQENLARAEEIVTSLRGTEGELLALKNRLNSIDALRGQDEKRKAIFNLIVYLVPSSIQVSDISVDSKGQVALTMRSSSLQSIQELFDNLGNQEKNSNLVSQVDLNGFAMGKDSVYRFSLKIISK